MNNRRYSKFLAGLVTSLILLSLLVNSAMAAFVPPAGQSEAANTAQMLQFTSGGHALSFAAVSMEATPSSYTLHGDSLGMNADQPLYLRTGIDDITSFLEKCPNNDPVYSILRSDFKIRIDGVIVGDIPCSEPISSMPIEQYTNALITLQVFRTIYYMTPGVSNYLPWTSMSLYDWMASNVGGINVKTAPGQLYCCDIIDGEEYVSQSLQDDSNRDFKRTWRGISSTIDYYAHEIRHADGGPGHVTGCVAFPDPDGPLGCDTDYDLTNLGSYGVQYWLNQNWLTGYLDVGISCAPDGGLAYSQWHLNNLNYQFMRRFVNNIPPLAVMPDPPYGGPCFWPLTISGRAGVAGATLNYTDGTSKTATTDDSGNYSFEVPYNWSGTVTPSMTGYFFSPTSRTYSNVQGDQMDQNYTATLYAYHLYLPLVLGNP